MEPSHLAFAARIGGRNGVLAMIGTGFYFAWFDALFMGSLFPGSGILPRESELGALLIFAMSAIVAIGVLRDDGPIKRLLGNGRGLVVCSLLGCVGSAALIVSSFYQSMALIFAGALLCGCFMAVFQFGWCACFSHAGARTATPFLAGAYPCAMVFDLGPLFMLPVAGAVCFALFPLVSCFLFLCVDRSFRSYSDEGERLASERVAGHSWKSVLGMSMTLVIAFTLMFACFGYLQHFMSFASGGVAHGAVAVQIVRGIASAILFVTLVVLRWKSSAVYRAGLVVLIVGCMGSSLLIESGSTWAMSCITMSGFMAFNVLIYVAFSQVAYADSKYPCKTMAIMWVITGVGVSVGGLAAMILAPFLSNDAAAIHNESVILGYLVSIACVLLLSSNDIWFVLGLERREGILGDERTRLDGIFREASLTTREIEVASLLFQGRTQAWIAESLCISESTVATHVRHIYQKTEVHNRQQFLDFARSDAVSTKTEDMPFEALETK